MSNIFDYQPTLFVYNLHFLLFNLKTTLRLPVGKMTTGSHFVFHVVLILKQSKDYQKT